MTAGSRRLAGVAAAILLLAAGCSTDGDEPDLRAVDGTTTTTLDAGDDGGVGPDPGTAPSDEDPPAEKTGTTAGASPSTTSGAPAPSASVPAPGGVGGYAAFYLRNQESTRLLLDIRSQAGAEPSATTVEHLRSVLAEVSGKEVSVGGGSLSGDGRRWTAGEIRALADTGPSQSRDTAVIRILYLRGGFSDGDTVLGVAVRSDAAAVFADRIDEAAGPLGNRSRIEDAITIHEVGHLLGLVDLVLDRGRADPDHPGHSQNRGSVMYYAVESTLVGSILTGGPPTEFDADDLADLAAIRGG